MLSPYQPPLKPTTLEYAHATVGHTLTSLVTGTVGLLIAGLTIAHFPDTSNGSLSYHTALLGSSVGAAASSASFVIAGYSGINAVCRGVQTIKSFLKRD